MAGLQVVWFLLWTVRAAVVKDGWRRCEEAPWALCRSTNLEATRPETAQEQGLRIYGSKKPMPEPQLGGKVAVDESSVVVGVGEEVAFRCTRPNQGFLRTRRHPFLGYAVHADAEWSAVPAREARFDLLPSGPGRARLRSRGAKGGYLSMRKSDEMSPWMVSIASEGDVFRVEYSSYSLGPKNKTAGVRLFSERARAYVNCLRAGAVRGHGAGDRTLAAEKSEPSTLLEVIRSPFDLGKDDPFFHDDASNKRNAAKVSLDCSRTCRGDGVVNLGDDHDKNNNATTTTLLSGFPPIIVGEPPQMLSSPRRQGLICPSAFRDAADWVFAWPFEHFGERAWVAPAQVVSACLAKIPVIYAHANALPKVADFARQRLRRPFILVSGQSDFAVSRSSKTLLAEPLLLKWFAQNADVRHAKIVQLPIGLNCFEHGDAMARALDDDDDHDKKRDKLLWVNFGYTHARRKVAWTHFCGSNGLGPQPRKQPPHNIVARQSPAWKAAQQTADAPSCVSKSQAYAPAATGQGHTNLLVDHYRHIKRHKYVASPRGNGIDTHRFWEALYLGAIPVVESSPLDPLYQSAGALVVDSWTHVTPTLLRDRYHEHKSRTKNATRLLSPLFWQAHIESIRHAAGAYDYADTTTAAAQKKPRTRCWGSRSSLPPPQEEKKRQRLKHRHRHRR